MSSDVHEQSGAYLQRATHLPSIPADWLGITPESIEPGIWYRVSFQYVRDHEYFHIANAEVTRGIEPQPVDESTEGTIHEQFIGFHDADGVQHIFHIGSRSEIVVAHYAAEPDSLVFKRAKL